ncbi:hypothetical protein GGE67_005361 [Rhizobium leucaenae]|uniref:Uncharacterized protein n=1 Tax=Rhizobium leucaenae TaxID=29450 RepID=A0A7W6ZTA0_9HYPH|nr:hypothetical protein [Rhizobium leucaenae]MBB6304702.1 hypothetical protein [Rhizobium leucaenae]
MNGMRCFVAPQQAWVHCGIERNLPYRENPEKSSRFSHGQVPLPRLI